LTGGVYTKAFYLSNLKMLFELYNHARKAGTAKIEEEVDNPEKSPIFSKYPDFMKLHHAVAFLCDTLRMACSGGVEPMDIDNMMEADLEVHHREANEPVSSLSTMADALPGLGIVAAVLGVVITMGSLGGPKEEIGHKVASALVGTFFGHPAVLRRLWPAGFGHGETDRGGDQLLQLPAHRRLGVRQGDEPHAGG